MELKAIYDKRKSFYKKARIKKSYNRLTLISYKTEVAYIDLEERKSIILEEYKNYSQTTIRHINEFLKQMDSLIFEHEANERMDKEKKNRIE